MGARRRSPSEVQDRLLVPALAKEAKVTDGVIVLARRHSRETLIVLRHEGAGAKLKSLDADFQKALLKVIRPAAHCLPDGGPRRAERGG